MNDTERTKLLSAAFTDVETIVGNHAMRPLSLATYDILLRTFTWMVTLSFRNSPAISL